MELGFVMEWAVSLLTLTALEIVLGIDNIVLISILVEQLPDSQKDRARQIGLVLALVARILLLSTALWLTKLTGTLFAILGNDISVRDLILIIGGLFLLAKATTEIFNFVQLHEEQLTAKAKTQFAKVIVQIIIFDLIFSLDSVLTAVGLTQHLDVMIVAVVLAIIFMMIFAKSISLFVHANPGIKMLALTFLVMIGMLLIAEGLGSHFDRGYVYFAMVFSLGVELLNKRRTRKTAPK